MGRCTWEVPHSVASARRMWLETERKKLTDGSIPKTSYHKQPLSSDQCTKMSLLYLDMCTTLWYGDNITPG